MRAVRIIAVITLLAPLSAPGAQQVQGALSVSGGSATDVLGVTSRALTVSPTLAIAPDAHALLTLQAAGTRYDNAAWSLTGGAGAVLRAPLGRYFAAALNGGADATATSYEFSYRTATLSPVVEAYLGPLTAYAGIVGAAASATTTSTSPARQIPGLLGSRTVPGQTMSNTSQRNAAASLVGVSLALLQQDNVQLIVGGRTEPGIQRLLGSATLSVGVARNAALEVSAGAYSQNQLVGVPAGRFVNVGLSFRGARTVSHLPEPDGVAAPANGLTRLSLSAPDAARVEVAGDFDNWKPLAARRAGNGVWYVDLRIPAGRYRYAFRVDGGAWTVPQGAPTVDDDFGGKSAWLVVSQPGNSAR